jgi:hypothetical protein
MVHCREQILHTRYSRRLITMVKHAPFDEAAEREHFEQVPDPTLRIDRLHRYVYQPSVVDDATGKRVSPYKSVESKFRGKKV